jgi:hypothetical protein
VEEVRPRRAGSSRRLRATGPLLRLWLTVTCVLASRTGSALGNVSGCYGSESARSMACYGQLGRDGLPGETFNESDSWLHGETGPASVFCAPLRAASVRRSGLIRTCRFTRPNILTHLPARSFLFSSALRADGCRPGHGDDIAEPIRLRGCVQVGRPRGERCSRSARAAQESDTLRAGRPTSCVREPLLDVSERRPATTSYLLPWIRRGLP